MKNKWSFLIIFAVVVACAVVFWALAIVAYKCFSFALEPTNVILTLVGILATFVVVSNYMQVRDVKDEFGKEVQKIRSELGTKKQEVMAEVEKILESKVQEIRVEFGKEILEWVKRFGLEIATVNDNIKLVKIYDSFDLFSTCCAMEKYDIALPIGIDALHNVERGGIRRMVHMILKELKDKRIVLSKIKKAQCSEKVDKLIKKFPEVVLLLKLQDMVNTAETDE
ncbi:MAG: hypothetical protein LBJ57_07600 [Prevotellaceae bacterium]|nr:hypothetical protein [Prevotellaceae bacterium]